MKTEIKHNGRTLKEIVKNLPSGMIPRHKKMYLKNILQILRREANGLNADPERNANFILISAYNGW